MSGGVKTERVGMSDDERFRLERRVLAYVRSGLTQKEICAATGLGRKQVKKIADKELGNG